jgi:Domain of unknown function (DUF4124)
MMIRILIIVLIVLAGAAALTELNPSAEKTTNPIMKGLNTVRGWFGSSDALTLPDANKTTVYKWQDATGEWHFSNQPPPAGINSSVKTYRSDVNITQAPAPPVAPKPEPTEKSAAIPKGPAPLLPITDPGRVEQLIDDAKNVQKLVNDRQKNLDAQLPP